LYIETSLVIKLLTVVLHTIHRSVILVKIMYASSAWFSFLTQSDKLRINSSIQHGSLTSCALILSFSMEIEVASDAMFKPSLNYAKLLLINFFELYCLIAIMYLIPLPEKSNAFYYHNLRPRLRGRLFYLTTLYVGVYCLFSHSAPAFCHRLNKLSLSNDLSITLLTMRHIFKYEP
jgi:hypothetical protein